MSTAQNAVTAEPGNGSAAIRARVGDSAIDKVTRLFSGWPRRYFHRDAAKLTPWRSQPRCRDHRAGWRYHPRYPRR